MAEVGEWRTATAVVKGTSHERHGVECQDFGGVRYVVGASEETLLLFVADGAGSATRSRDGAEFFCGQFVEFFSGFFASGRSISEITRATGEAWIGQTREGLRRVASLDEAHLRDYACTFLGAILGKSGSRFVQVGDGAIVYSDVRDQYAWASWPEQAEYANVTYFVTQDDAEAHLQFEEGPEVFEVAIFSDGLQRLALQMAAKRVHDPFFVHLFSRLRTEAPGASKNMEDALLQLLTSPAVLSRTDDDMTLVLATRLSQEDVSAGVGGLDDTAGKTGIEKSNAETDGPIGMATMTTDNAY